MNTYWYDYNILINSSPFFVAALVKKFMIEHFPGFFTFIFRCKISFWVSVLLLHFLFLPLFHASLEHSICICCPLRPTCVCLYVVKILSKKSVISIFSVAMFVSFSRFSLFQIRYSCKITEFVATKFYICEPVKPITVGPLSFE